MTELSKSLYIIRANHKQFGGAEIYLERLSEELSAQKIPHTIIHSKIPRLFFSWIRALFFNFQVYFQKNSKFYFSLDRITCPDIYRAGDGVHKKYMQITNQSIFKPLNFIYSYIEKRAFENAKHIIAISNMVKQDIITSYHIPSEKISVIYNGIKLKEYDDKESFKKIQNEFSITKIDKIILYVGSGYKRKGVKEFLTIISKIKHKNIKAFVIGKEKQFHYYQELAKTLKISEKVIFTGPRKDVDDFYAITDLFLFPTYYEPFGNVILEAMSFKNAVITTRQCGAGELLEQTELMQNPTDYTISKRIEFLLKNPKELKKIKDTNFSKSKLFTIQKNANTTMAIISKFYYAN